MYNANGVTKPIHFGYRSSIVIHQPFNFTSRPCTLIVNLKKKLQINLSLNARMAGHLPTSIDSHPSSTHISQ